MFSRKGHLRKKKKIKDPDESKTSYAKMCMGIVEFGRGLGSQNRWGRTVGQGHVVKAFMPGWNGKTLSDLKSNCFDQK